MKSWPAPGDTPHLIYVMHATYLAPVMGAIFYGIHAALFFFTINALMRRDARKKNRPFIAYAVVMFICGTLYLAGSINWRMRSFIDDRGYPGGPAMYYFEQFSNPSIIASNCGYVVINFLADGLLLWRCWVIYGKSWLVVIIPGLMFMTSTALSIVATYSLSRPDLSRLGAVVVRISLPYWLMSMLLNVVVTLLICGRLLSGARNIRSSHNARVFKGIMTMLVESAALYSTFGIVIIVFYVKKDPMFDTMFHIQGQLMCIAPLLILIRVAAGRAYAQTHGQNIFESSQHGNNPVTHSMPVFASRPPRPSQTWKKTMNDTVDEEIMTMNDGIRSTVPFNQPQRESEDIDGTSKAASRSNTSVV